jgi:Zn-dependent protease with chaperone function
MFALRLVAVALAIFVLTYSLLSLAVATGWKFSRKLWQESSASRAANFLFALRLLPLAGALAVTSIYAVPSFLILEPSQVEEPLGPALAVLAVAGLIWLSIAIFRAVAAQTKISQVLAKWVADVEAIDHRTSVPVLRLSSDDPVLTVAGIRTPKVLVSGAAVANLTADELEAALRHEMAHVRHRDNLKKLLLRFASCPAMGALETAWAELSEMAADDAAISDASEALDLASALIKLSRFACTQPSHALASSLLPATSPSLTARLKRLFDWTGSEIPKRSAHRAWTGEGVLAVLLCTALTYGPMLTGMHAITEWLVR